MLGDVRFNDHAQHAQVGPSWRDGHPARLNGGDLIKQPDGQEGLPQGSDIPVNQIPDLACQMARSRQLQTVRTPQPANRPADTLEGCHAPGIAAASTARRLEELKPNWSCPQASGPRA
jgi:hypothetical protein